MQSSRSKVARATAPIAAAVCVATAAFALAGRPGDEGRDDTVETVAIVIVLGLASFWLGAMFRAPSEAPAEPLEVDRALGRFLANMSHEIRTPMTSVLGMVKLMQSQPLDPKTRRYVEVIDASANALLTIVNDILDFSKLEAGKYSIAARPFAPETAIREVAELLAPRAHDKNVEVVYRVDPAVPSSAVGDETRVKQVLANLVGNAIKFTDVGDVFIDASVASRTEDTVVLRVAVSDTGIGIAAADMPKLFEAFSQVDESSHGRGPGTGLGLAISRGFVKTMGGDIDVASEPGKGSVFTFTVRLGVDRSPAPAVVSRDALAGKRVLLVEANRHWRDVIAEDLSGWRAEAEIVDRTSAALDALSGDAVRSKFEAIAIGGDADRAPISDVVRAIRAKEPFRTTPIVVLTMLTTDAAREIEGNVLVLSKPLRSAELYDALLGSWTVHARQSRPPEGAAGATILVVDDNEVNRFVVVEELELRGYRVEVASNGLEAIERVKRGGLSALLMDCQMPAMDGYAASAEIRRWERESGASRVPIVALTAHALAGERERALEAGMDDYLSKPFHASSLGTILRRFGDRSLGALSDD